MGSGPFSLKQFSKGQFTHLVRNPHYWQKGKPYRRRGRIDYVTDDNTRILKLQAGEVDVADAHPLHADRAAQQGRRPDVQIEPLFRCDGIWLNNAKKPLDDKKVRQALNYATDKAGDHRARPLRAGAGREPHDAEASLLARGREALRL